MPLVIKNLPADAGVSREMDSSLDQEDPWRRELQPSPVFLLGKSHGQRSLTGYSPWGCKESDTAEHEHRQAYRGNIFTNIFDNLLFPTHHFLAV